MTNLNKAAREALERFKECGGHEVPDPVERLRVFCSLAMTGRDWLDVEPFFDDVLAERASAMLAARPSVPQGTRPLGPSVPDEVMAYVHAYGDSRADDDGRSALRIGEVVLALRRWAAMLAARPEAPPVARMACRCAGKGFEFCDCPPKVATTVALTDEQVVGLYVDLNAACHDAPTPTEMFAIIVRAAIAKFCEVNGLAQPTEGKEGGA